MSEAATSAHYFEPYCRGKLGIDMGFGFSAFINDVGCLTLDMVEPYTRVGGDKQILRGTCEDLSGFCDESLDYIHHSHLCEDYTYPQLTTKIIPEWRRVLKVGGYLCTNAPWQKKYLEINERNGTMETINLAHKEPDMGLDTWNHHVISNTGPWEVILEVPEHGPYSWLQILKKL